MQFRDLKAQYNNIRDDINREISRVIDDSNFIMGNQVRELEEELAEYVGVKHCLSCGNGTDALQLAAMALDIKKDDAVFVPDFTFFASGEIISLMGATPVFVDVNYDTFNISPLKLEEAILNVKKDGKLNLKAVIAVDLFGLPADYPKIKEITDKYGLYLIEDGAQGFGGEINGEKACSFGDISTTSFFPAKPLGCYGDGGSIFTNNDKWANLIDSYRVHGKGENKYDNVRIGINSRLDTIQAAILLVKLKAFKNYELKKVNRIANIYTNELSKYVKTPIINNGFMSSWAQYTIKLESKQLRDQLQIKLREEGIPSMIYYPKPMHMQQAFKDNLYNFKNNNTNLLCDTVLSLPMHPYLEDEDINLVINSVKSYNKII